MPKSRKKLIEVALPLVAINVASAREKSIRHGHPSTLHLWWARRPLAAARAVIFAQMVDDPSSCPELFPTEPAQEKERQRLFRIIEELVLWENTTNEEVLQKAREEIRLSWLRACEDNKNHPRAKELFDPHKLPGFHDPFAGGGALPLEAQWLGLESYASDLNPVAVLINKAMIEIPPKFTGLPPVNPAERKDKQLFNKTWRGAQGLAEDVRYYGQWMRDEAEKRIGHLYPKIEITPEMAQERTDLEPYVGRKLTVIAWLWARTVKTPNPAFAQVDVPLVSTFMLSTKAGKEAYVEPVIENDGYRFTVKVGKPKDAEAAKNGTKLSRGANFQCIMSGTPIAGDYIKNEGRTGGMGARLMAIVAEGDRGRIYLTPTMEQESIVKEANPTWRPSGDVPSRLTGGTCYGYGLTEWGDLFTPRQLVALTTFSDLVLEARERVKRDAVTAGFDSSTPAPTPTLPRWGRESYSSPQRGEVRRGEVERGEIERGEAERREWHPTPVPPALLSAARALRKNMTNAEQVLWKCLRGKQLDSFRFRKQHPIERYVLDFYCPSVKLAIELDGGQHNTDEGKEKDEERTAWLARKGIRVLRFWNFEVLNNIEGVVALIWDVLHESDPHPNPPPLGEGVVFLPPTGGGQEGGITRGRQEWGNSTGGGQERDAPLANGGTGAQADADAVAVYLAFGVDKCSDYWSSICSWHSSGEKMRNTFGRQAIPMVWDYAEANPMCDSSGNWMAMIDWTWKALETTPAMVSGEVRQHDSQNQSFSVDKVISTDPPYYDNIGYADLSDFFYVWLQRSLKPVFPDLFATLAVPKAEELVATPYRHGSREKAEAFFLDGMTRAMHRLAEQAHPAFPVTIYYAFKQSETESEGTTSTGWVTFLDAVIQAGFALTGTWPMRTELSNRMICSGTNALASSIVLVCRKRADDAPMATRREFLNALKTELPPALSHMLHGNIAPVDLAQATIGPGMAIFTRYCKVMESDGTPMPVRTALSLINQALDEFLSEQESEYDAWTRWALTWFEQYAHDEAPYGEAEILATAKGIAVQGLVETGILQAKSGKVRLLKREELLANWDPQADERLTVWEVSQYLIRALLKEGIPGAAKILRQTGGIAGAAHGLAYRLYTVCERKSWANEALAYNSLIVDWPRIWEEAKRIGVESKRPSEQTFEAF